MGLLHYIAEGNLHPHAGFLDEQKEHLLRAKRNSSKLTQATCCSPNRANMCSGSVMINAMAIKSICPKTKCHGALLSAEGAAFLNVCRRCHGCVWTSKIGVIGFNVELGGAAGVLDVIRGRSRSASDNLDVNRVVNRCANRPRFSNQLTGW